MLEVDAATGTLTIPIWAVGAASAVFLALVVLAIGRAGVAASVNVLFRVSIAAIAVSAGWLYIQQSERQEHAAQRRLLDERSAALTARAVAPGSALSCLDELAGEAVEAACEKAVFASPEAVAAAVTYVTAKLALLVDDNDHARRIDPKFASELAPVLAAFELDRFGIVAHVLASRHGCTAESCPALAWFGDYSHVRANLRDHTFDEEVAKFAAFWNSPSRTAMDGPPGEAPRFAPAPAAVSSRYDFPSSQSIPPVNIMVPETPSPRGAPNAQAATPSGEGSPRPAAAPTPPRRPVRAARPAAPRPTAPVAVGEAPTDGSVRPSGSGQPQ